MLTWELVDLLAPVELTRSAKRMWRVRGVPYKMRLAIIAWGREQRKRIRIDEFDQLPLHRPKRRNGARK